MASALTGLPAGKQAPNSAERDIRAARGGPPRRQAKVSTLFKGPEMAGSLLSDVSVWGAPRGAGDTAGEGSGGKEARFPESRAQGQSRQQRPDRVGGTSGWGPGCEHTSPYTHMTHTTHTQDTHTPHREHATHTYSTHTPHTLNTPHTTYSTHTTYKTYTTHTHTRSES